MRYRGEKFELSIDPLFVDKVRDMVRLYLSQPNMPFLPSIDGKSQIQALEPLRRGLPRTLLLYFRRYTRTKNVLFGRRKGLEQDHSGTGANTLAV